jgi:uncharacterized protein
MPLACALCKKPVLPRAQNDAYPFCSQRCRMVDLGRWLGEEYRVSARMDVAEDELPEGQLRPSAGDDTDLA